jgi:hypothetical protein
MKRRVLILAALALIVWTSAYAASLYTGYAPNAGGVALPISPTPYPNGATFVISTGGGANTAGQCFLPNLPGRTTYITGFRITGFGATGAGTSTVTVSSIQGPNSWNYEITIPAGAAVPITPLIENFPTPIPGNGTDTSILVAYTAFGTGNLTSQCIAFGYII